MKIYPPFIAAAVQAAPVYLEADATVELACRLIAEAAHNQARLVAFPEVFVAGYPYWNWTMNPVEGSAWYERLYVSAIDVPGPQTERLCAAARQANCVVVIGVNERGAHSYGTLYNTVLMISAQGHLIGRHRKLVPTWAEKLTWTGGDGSSLTVHETELGPIGALACGENTNTLARFSLLAQGELIHIANYIALPVAPDDYDMVEAIKLRAAAHAFEGKVFNIVSCSAISEPIITAVAGDDPKARAMLERKNSAFSGIFGPDGRLLTEPLIDREGIVYAQIDLSKCIQPKQMHDIVGHYNRFDIFSLSLNKRPLEALNIITQEPLACPRVPLGTEASPNDERFTAGASRHEG
ncbi:MULTISPECIES: carbon-nitrogen hydrolase family protein [Pseudomonas]|uniref:Carbon-nitrogen hydrolase family protein n=2 Tax=Pseudomonas gessardii TaxID=78544 RepID=A0A7Y1QLR8_9PSED|nr:MULTISPECIES: carbon-nitrogen hydrolase family protein [Pseudomonas]MBH3422293.1 carbon-nitrogen hydrolase family protein [Pseudomonas gessardii]MCF4978648.1 carbon-nitrogen hydrolase family protein [Pseudomonas gessardii]MCF4991884.1 carbon-nitrogen hydrolase family protein [Pseudomonas gessardii]MCF5110015.1 carbon-nitrogen hydrolase family protein [Pseudomonas gessardii]MRU48891.1 carbon-nitrogen hydrolase family protein [Pseudomonas gessardii]